jgi:hypothetical protein
MGLAWLASNAVQRDKFVHITCCKIVRAKSNPKLGTEENEPDKAHCDHTATLTPMVSSNRIEGPGSA